MAIGVLALALVVLNHLTTPLLTPPQERADALASLLAVGLMLVSILWTRAVPRAPESVSLQGEQGLDLEAGLPTALEQEIGWGSQMLLTATPAAAVVLWWHDRILLRRGVLAEDSTDWRPGPIARKAMAEGRSIGLVNLALYPGRHEFEAILPRDVPSVVVQPIGPGGLMLVAGWSPRCFSRSDEIWIEGWSRKLRTALESWQAGVPMEPLPVAGE